MKMIKVLLTMLLCTSFLYAEPIKIIAFGTSFTDGKGVWRSDAWTTKLNQMLKTEGFNIEVVNEGVSGNTTLDLKRRMNFNIPSDTKIVIFEYAIGNDTKAGISIDETVRNTDEMISILVDRNIQVLLVIRGYTKEALERRANYFKPMVAKHGIMSIEIEQPESSLLSDRQHPNPQGHILVAEALRHSIKEMLKK